MKPNDATIYSKSGFLLKVDVTTSWVLVEIDETQKRKLWSLPTHLSSGNSGLLNHVTIKKRIQIHLIMTAAKERNPPIKFRMTSHAGTWVFPHARRSSNITASNKFPTNWLNINTSKVERSTAPWAPWLLQRRRSYWTRSVDGRQAPRVGPACRSVNSFFSLQTQGEGCAIQGRWCLCRWWCSRCPPSSSGRCSSVHIHLTPCSPWSVGTWSRSRREGQGRHTETPRTELGPWGKPCTSCHWTRRRRGASPQCTGRCWSRSSSPRRWSAAPPGTGGGSRRRGAGTGKSGSKTSPPTVPWKPRSRAAALRWGTRRCRRRRSRRGWSATGWSWRRSSCSAGCRWTRGCLRSLPGRWGRWRGGCRSSQCPGCPPSSTAWKSCSCQ